MFLFLSLHLYFNNWDYGKNGKGYYNDIFAPGWTVASLWELLTPGRAERFLLD